MKWKSVVILSLSFTGIGLAEMPKVSKAKHNQAVLLELGSMWVNNVVGDINAVSLGYERQIGNTPFSFQLHLHGGYKENGGTGDQGDTAWAAGVGLTLRRYLGETPEGSFGQVQSDFVKGERTEWLYNYSSNPYSYLPTTQESLLSLTQVSIGYKWALEYFVMEAAVGGGLYFTQSEKFTSLAATFNVGAPF